MEEKIVLTDDEGNEVEMYVVEETRINNVNYILVTEEGDEEEEIAHILKDVSDENDEEAIYEMVEDDSELDYIGRIFSELLEDIDIERYNRKILSKIVSIIENVIVCKYGDDYVFRELWWFYS